MKEIECLGPADWAAVHGLMVKEKFPDVPLTLAAAEPFFRGVRLYGLRDAYGLGVVWIFGADDVGVSFLDVVCAPRWRGKWATARVLKVLYRLAFGEMRLRCLWVQPKNKVALRAALMAGFVPGTPLDVKEPILMMTPWGARKQWMEERQDGKFV